MDCLRAGGEGNHSKSVENFSNKNLLFALWILLLQLLQDVHLQLSSFPVLVHIFNNLEGKHLIPDTWVK